MNVSVNKRLNRLSRLSRPSQAPEDVLHAGDGEEEAPRGKASFALHIHGTAACLRILRSLVVFVFLCQIIEKRRRDRINNSLLELRRLVPTALEKQVRTCF